MPPEIPQYTGAIVSFCKRPLIESPEPPWRTQAGRRHHRRAVRRRGRPIDPGARFGPRAIRQATYTHGGHSLQLGVEPFEVLDVVDAGDANVVPAALDRGHAMIYRKVLEVASSGAIPIILGGDHSITWPSASAVAQARAPRSIGIVHFDAHADTANDDWGVLAGHGTPMRRLIESGAVKGSNFVQVGLRGYWPPPDVFAWMREHGMRWHLMREIEERGAEAVVDDAIDEALDGPDAIYLSIDIDVHRSGHGARDRHARAGRPADARAAARHSAHRRQRRARGMDVVEVSPPYDHADVTAAAAHRCVLEAISALAVKKRDGQAVRHEPDHAVAVPASRFADSS